MPTAPVRLDEKRSTRVLGTARGTPAMPVFDMQARSIRREFYAAPARKVLDDAGFGRGQRVYALTGGDFGFIDWLEALIAFVGEPPAYVISTWVTAAADLNRLYSWMTAGRLGDGWWLINPMMRSREPKLLRRMQEVFGADAIRFWPTHAKFALLRAGDWRIVTLTSANLNENQAIEFFSAQAAREEICRDLLSIYEVPLR